MKLGDILEVEIEKLVYGGDGLARVGAEEFVVFVKNSIPKDKLKIKITSLNKKFARGEILEILDSPNRIKPFCALYNACGSCDCQIMSYEFLLRQKTNILKDIFKNVVCEDEIYPVISSKSDKFYRHKIQFPARQTKNSKRILLGYYKKNSHDLTNIKYCPLQVEIMNEIAQYIRENFKLDCYDEKTKKGLLKNVLARVSSYSGDVLLTLVLNCDENKFSEFDSLIFRFFKKLMSAFPAVKGGFVNFNSQNTNKILTDDTLKIAGDDFIIEKLGKKIYKIGATSFFQVNPETAAILFDVIKKNIKPNSTILDAYGGVGAIGIYLSDYASKITLVEENKNAISMASENFKLNNVENYEIFEGDAKKHFLNFEKENKKFDFAILDPPRSGCEKEGLLTISKLAKNIIYVSCNPQTLKRDMSLLIENGFKPKFIQGVDLFPYTHHIESVCLFEREKDV